MSILNLDISAKIDIHLLANHSMDITVLWYADKAKQIPFSLSGTIKLVAKNNVTGQLVEILEGDGISKENNILTISRNKTQNSFTPGTWSYEIRADFEDGKSLPYMKGKIISNG